MKHSGTEDLPNPVHKLKDKTAHKVLLLEALTQGNTTAKPSWDTDDSISHSSTHRTAH